MSFFCCNFARKSFDNTIIASMKKYFLLFALMVIAVSRVAADAIDYDKCWWFNYKRFSQNVAGVCLTPNWGTNDPDDDVWIKYSTHGNAGTTVWLAAGSQVIIDAGFVNIKHVVFLLYTGSAYVAPLMPSVGAEPVVTMETVDETEFKAVTWTNPGQLVGTVTFTVGEKATWSDNSAYHDKPGEVDIFYVLVDLGDEESGACGVEIPTDTVVLSKPAVSFKDESDYEWPRYEYEMTIADTKAGVTITCPFELDEKDQFAGTYKNTGVRVKKDGESRKNASYSVLTIKQNKDNAKKYDFHLDAICDGTMYQMDWTGAVLATSEAFSLEPTTPTNITFVPTSGEYDAYWLSDGELDVSLYSAGEPFDYLELYFVTKTKVAGTIVSPGTYPINRSGDLGTVLASNGVFTAGAIFYPQAKWASDYLDTNDEYYPESGTVKVEASTKGVKMTIDATTHYGSTIQGVYEGKLEDASLVTGVDRVQNTEYRIQKVLRDGQILIIRNDKTYTILGIAQ